MTYAPPSETACACLPVIRETVDFRIDPRASETARHLDDYADRFGPRLAEAITVGAIGRGPLANRFSKIGNGTEALHHAHPGDVLIARGLFADSDPRVDIVGFDPKLDLGGLVESLDAPDAVELYRPSGNAENAKLIQLISMAGGIPTPNDVLKGLNSAADLKLKQIAIKDAEKLNRQPKFTSQTVSLISEHFRTNHEATAVHKFSIIGKRRSAVSSYFDAQYEAQFEVTVRHDCINILAARITSLNSQARDENMPYTLTVDISADVESAHKLPPEVRMTIVAEWNPDKLSDKAYDYSWGFLGTPDESHRVTAELFIRADGKVMIKPITKNAEVRITSITSSSGVSKICEGLYKKIRSKNAGNAGNAGTNNSGRNSNMPSGATRPHPRHGRNIFFGFRSFNPQRYARKEVEFWWNGLPNGIKASIAQGKRALYVTGHADYTGGDRFNVRLSKRRAEEVAELIRQVTNKRLPMMINGKGWHDARRAGERRGRPNQNWRVVTISLDNPG